MTLSWKIKLIFAILKMSEIKHDDEFKQLTMEEEGHISSSWAEN